MSRPLRIQYPGAWYHVMNRGLNRRRIFHNDSQRLLFIDLLAEIHTRYGVQIHAYCLMDNHYHLLLHTPEGNLSRAMRHLDGLYTQRFNRQEKRDGPLFRGRYKAILIETEHYGLVLSRYIHLNPVNAKFCLQPEDYIWSSYSAYIRCVKRPVWLSCEEMLFRCSANGSINNYREFIAEGVNTEIARLFAKKRQPSLLGSESWLEELKKAHGENLVDDEIPESKCFREDKEDDELQKFMQYIADYYKVSLCELKKKSSRGFENKARNHFVYLAVTYYGYENKKIANLLGNISDSAVSQIRTHLEKKIVKDKFLRLELEELKARFQII